MNKPVIALTMGDPGGIGPEIILKTLRRRLSSRFSYVVIGALAPFEVLKKKYGDALPWTLANAWKDVQKPGLHFWDLSKTAGISSFDPKRVSKRNAQLAYQTLRFAAGEAARGRIQAIVTAPIHKTAMRLVLPGFHGHTEFLAQAAKIKQYAMMFVSPRLKVTLVTIHVPLRKVHSLIRAKTVFEKIQLTHDFLKKRLSIKNPKIAVCALNPHGRETGNEDESQIRPAVQKAKRMGIHASGPLSADQIFHEAYEGRFDAVVSMYHDQGLAPFKMIAFRDGVNVTLGLPFVRTSPDHGTAYDIAYQNKADASSFEASLRLAEKLLGV